MKNIRILLRKTGDHWVAEAIDIGYLRSTVSSHRMALEYLAEILVESILERPDRAERIIQHEYNADEEENWENAMEAETDIVANYFAGFADRLKKIGFNIPHFEIRVES